MRMSDFNHGDRDADRFGGGGFGRDWQLDRARAAAREFSQLGKRIKHTYIFCRGASSSTSVDYGAHSPTVESAICYESAANRVFR